MATDPESYSSGDDFEYEGKHEAKLYVPTLSLDWLLPLLAYSTLIMLAGFY